jgi:hypothetical protein
MEADQHKQNEAFTSMLMRETNRGDHRPFLAHAQITEEMPPYRTKPAGVVKLCMTR